LPHRPFPTTTVGKHLLIRRRPASQNARLSRAVAQGCAVGTGLILCLVMWRRISPSERWLAWIERLIPGGLTRPTTGPSLTAGSQTGFATADLDGKGGKVRAIAPRRAQCRTRAPLASARPSPSRSPPDSTTIIGPKRSVSTPHPKAPTLIVRKTMVMAPGCRCAPAGRA